ncbi:MAG: cysteine hydrolase family protein [Gemmatimonadetes bacterium]|nr:cysteine hydrolase family protein [Gemmatimonadota bacterium]
MGRTARLKTRYYRALPIDAPGYEEEVFELSLEKTALVGMHCWNIGCPDGPPVDVDFCVGMGWPQATEEAGRIMREIVRPAMDAARRAGMPVCHVESDWMDGQYPDVTSRRRRDRENFPEGRVGEMLARAHGRDYLGRSPLASMRRAEIVSPQGEEPLVFYTDQLDAYLKERGIETLIYTGFATDMCVLGADGGARPMLGLGYRCILMRDATVGVETPASFEERLATRYGTHLFEWQVGFSTTYRDFCEALEGG